ncbi:MAG: AMP-binding protein, partial [Planctomycetes bacterium]|nr:AMP-binding protein [Planctomycetota bacterium]
MMRQTTGPVERVSSLIQLLRVRAATQPDDRAFTFLGDGEVEESWVTFQQLDARARRLAGWLQSEGACGERVLLLYPSGLEFIAAFFGCLYAGAVAVPAYPPRRNRAMPQVRAILADARAKIALTTSSLLPDIEGRLTSEPELATVRWQATDTIEASCAVAWREPDVSDNTLAFLQYTSGSTGMPKGVMVSHGNLIQNEEMIGHAFQTTRRSIGVSWLPLYHDMGLIGLVLHPLYIGAHSILMSPVSFLQRPIRWLKAISDYRATISGGPNFAYELCTEKIAPGQCAGLDLSCWEVAFSGAEPVKAEALERFASAFAPCGFRRKAFYPCYGMAEATLIITGGLKDEQPVLRTFSGRSLTRRRVVEGNGDRLHHRTLVGCGTARPGQRLVIVDPDRLTRCGDNEVGEIWVSGPNVAQGYWNRAEETKRVFDAHLAGNGDGGYLRTGDLGFVAEGELYVTGRLKNLIIIRGRNYYPHDIEVTVEQSHPALRTGNGAAFSVEIDGEERLVVCQEVERGAIRNLPVDEVFGAIQAAVAEHHDLQLEAVLLLKTSSIPKTSSGKIKHHACRMGFLDGSLEVVAQWRRSAGADAPVIPGELVPRNDEPAGNPATVTERPAAPGCAVTAKAIQQWLVAKLAERLKVPESEIDVAQPFARYGLDSVAAVGLANALEERLQRPVPPTIAYDYPTVELLARHLAEDSRVTHETFARQGAAGARSATLVEPIAVVGLGCRFPGATGPDAFWALMRDGRDAITPVPSDRWDVDRYFDANPSTPEKMNTRWGGFLDQVDRFDATFFGISRPEAENMDPQQRLLLEVSWEALEHAGIAPHRLAGTQSGVFVGISSGDYARLQFDQPGGANVFAGTGNAASIAANRVSYVLDLRGPSWTVDTACSSSLVAVHQACRSLRQQECDLAIAGGVNVILSPELTVSFSQAGFMASDGRCKAFDAAADGYVRGEGCGVVVLKRLSDALRDRDPIRAVIAGSAVNQDGRSNGLTAPNGPSQQAVVRSALDNAGVTPAEISYIEAHGTGTSLGDPIEVNSLKTVLMEGRAADQRCFIGSVKTNIGHLEAAAGIAGLIKVVLAMERGEIPPHLHLKRLNPNIAIDNTPLSIPAQRTAWPAAARRLAGVSSFGFGGTNAHVIVAQPPALEPAECSQERTRHLLTVSARSDAARRELARRYAAELEAHPETSPGDFCHTANTGRSHGAYRWAAVAGSTEQLRDQLAAFAAGSEPASCATGTVRSHEPPRVALLFTGQGSQYAGMGRQLFQTQPTFRAVLEQCHELLKPYLDRPLLSLLFPQSDGDALLLDQTKYAQPALFALEYALASLWGSWGIEPTLVMGHSVGEYAAACFAGVFGLEDGLRLIAERGARMQELPGDGAMVAVMAGEQRVLDAIGPFADDVAVAALNGPAQVVISGRAAALDRLVAELSRQGIPSKKLRVSHAFHSPLVDPMLDKFEHFCRRIRFRQPQRRLVSNVTGAPVNGEVCRPEYWRRHTRQPVRFAQSMAALRDAGCEVFLEVGPRPTLLGMGRACLPESDKYVWAASLRPQHDDWEQILSSLAAMYAHGVDCDWQELDRGFARRKLALPTYPFQRQRYWREMPADRPERSRSAGDPPAIHPLLGTRLPLAGKEVVYESRIGMFEPAFLADHRLGELAFVPVSAYLAIALAAARDARRESDLAVAGLAVERPLTLPENGTREIQVVLTPEGPADYSLVVAARDDDSDDDQPTWQRCVSARLVARERTEQPAPIDLAAILERCTQSVAPEDLYRRYRQWGVDYGPAFQVVERLWRGEGEGEGKAVGLIRLPQQLAEESSTYPIHPVMLDACVQVLGATLEQFDPDPRTTWLPAHVERFELVGRAGLTCYVEVTRRAPVDSDSTAIMADAIVIGAEGELVCRLDGLRLERVRRGVLSRSDQSPNDCLYQPQWRPQLRPGPQLAPEHQPAPGAVIERLRPTVAPVVVDVLLSNYDQLMDELEDLSVDFIVRAFHQLGWTPAIHDQFTTAAVIERLNVVAAHGRLVGRLLEILAEEGMLCREGDLWQVARLRDAGDPCQRVADLRGRHAEGDAHLILLERCASQLAGVLRGEVEPLDLLFPNGDTTTLSALYQDSPGARVMNDLVREAVAAVVDRLPDGRGVRLLEIGAGTGGTTAHLLPAMPAGRSEYVFTDVSAAFTTKAEEQFAAWPFLRTKVLDIEKSPTSQGFEAGSYDIVVAANVMHATRDLRESLTHARQLLAPGGLLVLLEGTAPQRWMDLTFGLTAGWWRFTDSERRPSYPLVSAFCWEDLFAECGFAESAAMSPDIERGRVRARQSVMVAQASVSHERRAGSAQAPDSPTGP